MMRVRGKEFYGSQNRWVSGSKDITYIARQVLTAAMEVTMASTSAPPGTYQKAADAIMDCLNGAMVSANNPVDLLAICRGELGKLPDDVRNALYENMSMGYLLQHIMGVRELTTTPFPSDEDMRDAVGQGMILSALPDEDKAKVINMLKRAGAYRRAELDRKAPPGEIQEGPDAEAKAGEDQTAAS